MVHWSMPHSPVDNYRIKYGPLSGGEHGELLFPAGPKDFTQAKITGTTGWATNRCPPELTN